MKRQAAVSLHRLDPMDVSCPVCFEYLDGDVYTCAGEGGHNTCGKCFSSMVKFSKDRNRGPVLCPTCRVSMSMTKNSSVSRLLAHCYVKCQNQGCVEKVPIKKIYGHMDSCQKGGPMCREGCTLTSESRSRLVHRRIECPLEHVSCFICSEKMPRCCLREHVIHEHSGDGQSYACQAKVDQDCKEYVSRHERFFYLDRIVVRGEALQDGGLLQALGATFAQKGLGEELLIMSRVTVRGSFGQEDMSIQIALGAMCPGEGTFPFFGVKAIATFSAELGGCSRQEIFWTSIMGLIPSGGELQSEYAVGSMIYSMGNWCCWAPITDIIDNSEACGENFSSVDVKLVSLKLEYDLKPCARLPLVPLAV